MTILWRHAAHSCRYELRSSAEWCEYFRRNRDLLLAIPWDEGVALTDAERRAIAKSVQTFQLGESGQGRHLLRCGERYAARCGDPEYPEALRLFVAEEQRHAAELGRFLDAAGLPRLERNWTDSLFRRCRHLAGLELTVAVLLTAELIALVYYAALRRATGSAVLRRICEQLLRDEVAHVRFQCEQLARIRRNRRHPLVRLTQLAQRMFFQATCLVVWCTHRRVFRAGAMSFASFWRAAQAEFRRAERKMAPQTDAGGNAHPAVGSPSFVTVEAK